MYFNRHFFPKIAQTVQGSRYIYYNVMDNEYVPVEAPKVEEEKKEKVAA